MTSAPASQSDSCVPEITLSGSPVPHGGGVGLTGTGICQEGKLIIFMYASYYNFNYCSFIVCLFFYTSFMNYDTKYQLLTKILSSLS